MSCIQSPFDITLLLAKKLIASQFPEFAHLNIESVPVQGHDNRSFRLGSELLIRIPTAEAYALKVPKEQVLLPRLAPYVSVRIPEPVRMGLPCEDFPYPFSIYKWLEGTSANLLTINNEALEQLAFDLAEFLKELQNISTIEGPGPGQHNWWRGAPVSVYDQQARSQIAALKITKEAMPLLEKAIRTQWEKPPVWIHGDFAIGNIVINDGKLSGVIDFGGLGVGDPACDLVIAWTFLKGKAREVFIREMNLDSDTWLRAKVWALWKATHELCAMEDKNSPDAQRQRQILAEIFDTY